MLTVIRLAINYCSDTHQADYRLTYWHEAGYRLLYWHWLRRLQTTNCNGSVALTRCGSSVSPAVVSLQAQKRQVWSAGFLLTTTILSLKPSHRSALLSHTGTGYYRLSITHKPRPLTSQLTFRAWNKTQKWRVAGLFQSGLGLGLGGQHHQVFNCLPSTF